MKFRSTQSILILSGIFLLAAAVRLWGINYGLPCTYCRPDEDRLITTALRLSCNDPNPHYFVWPALFFYLTRGVLVAAAGAYRLMVSGFTGSSLDLYRADPAFFHLVLRYIFCGFGLLTVYLLYRLGRVLFSPSTGLLAAFFLSLSFLHVRDSHFAMLDIPAALLAVGLVIATWNIYRRGRGRDYFSAGVMLGLASATKYYAVLLAFPLITAHFSRPASSEKGAWKPLAGALLLGAVIFLLGSPFTVIDAPTFIEQIREEIFSNQYIEGFPLVGDLATPRGWLYHLLFSFRYGLGWPLEILALLGVGSAAFRSVRGGVPERMILAFVVPFYLALSFQKSCFIRYTTLLIPFLCLLGASLLQTLRTRGRCSPGIVALLAVAIMVEPAVRVVGLDRVLSRPDTRNLTGDWMRNNVPFNAAVIYPQPFIFGRPEGFSRYPSRISLPAAVDAAAVRDLLARDFPVPTYAVIHESPLPYSTPDPEIKQLLVERGECRGVSGLIIAHRRRAVYDPFDAFYVPLAGFSAVAFPGPNIEIYRLK